MRIIASLLIALAVFTSGTVYTLSQTKVYEATGLLEVAPLQEDKNLNQIFDSFQSPVELALQVLRSDTTSKNVLKRLDQNKKEQEEELNRLFASYDKHLRSANNHAKTETFITIDNDRQFGATSQSHLTEAVDSSFAPETLIRFHQSRHVRPIPDTHYIEVTYSHPDPETAARIANLIMYEYINYGLTLDIDASMKAVEDLRIRHEQQIQRVDELKDALNQLRSSAAANQPTNSDKIKRLKEELSVQNESLEELAKWLTQSKVRIRSGPAPNHIIEMAAAPRKHFSPNIPLQVGLSGIAGMLSGCISFLALGKLRRSRSCASA